MKTVRSVLCLLLCAAMLFAAGCQKPGADTPAADVSENRCDEPAVLAYEQWLNGTLADMGYPLTVTFMEPDEEAVSEAAITCSDPDAQLLADYLFFYLFCDEGAIPVTCLSVREGAPDEVFAVHREISWALPTYFYPDITAERVDAVFAPEPDVNAEAASTLLGDSYVYTYGNGETFCACYYRDDGQSPPFMPFDLRTNPVTNRVWFFTYAPADYTPPAEDLSGLEACTHPEILALQQMINDACAREGYPLECDFAQDNNVKARFRYTGTGEDIYTPHFYMYADVYDSGLGEGETIHSLEFRLNAPSSCPAEVAEVYETLCADISAHFFPFTPAGTAELLFELETEEAVNKAGVPGVYTVPVVGAATDGFMRGYGSSGYSVYFRLTSYPTTDLYSFSWFPLQKPDTPALTAEAFRQRLEDALELSVHGAPNEIDEGYTEALHISIADEQNATAAVFSLDMHYGERSRLLNRLLITTYIWADSEEEKAMATPEILSQVMADIVSALDPEMDAEAFAAFCTPFYTGDWRGPETRYYDFTYGNIACRFYTKDAAVCCEIDLLAKENGRYDEEFSAPFTAAPGILELQQLINDTLAAQNYPIECIGFTNHMSNAYNAHFRYFGEGGDVYGTKDFNLYVNAAPGSDTPSDFNFPVWADVSPQGMQVFTDICKAVAAKYLPEADMEKVELLFTVEPDFTPGYTSQPDPEISAYMYEESDCFIREYQAGTHRISYVTYSGDSGIYFSCNIPHTIALTASQFMSRLDLWALISEGSGYHYGYSHDTMDIMKGDNSAATIHVAPAAGALQTVDIYSSAEPELIPQLFAAAVTLWDAEGDKDALAGLCEAALNNVSAEAQVFYTDEMARCSLFRAEGEIHCVIEFLAEPMLHL